MCDMGCRLYGTCNNLHYNIIIYVAVGNASTLTGAIAAGAACVPALALLLVGALITWCYYRRHQRKKKSDTHSTMDIINNFIMR